MLTLAEVLDDAAALPEFAGVRSVAVNTRGAFGWTPLHWMAYLGDLAGVELLLNAGAAVDAADDEGNTPLHEAVGVRHHLVVRVLVERGAQVGLENAVGLSPSDLADRDGYGPVLEVLGNAG